MLESGWEGARQAVHRFRVFRLSGFRVWALGFRASGLGFRA